MPEQTWTLPRIFYNGENAPPGTRLDNFPESAGVYRLNASNLHMAIVECEKMGADVFHGVLHVSLAMELAAWYALTTFNTSILRQHIGIISVDDRLKSDDPWEYPWAVSFGEIVYKSVGAIG